LIKWRDPPALLINWGHWKKVVRGDKRELTHCVCQDKRKSIRSQGLTSPKTN